MNDRFKFRGMTLGGEWVYGNLAVINKKIKPYRITIDEGYYISNTVGMPFAYPVRPETIGQCTGLKDKNGSLIYEGDVIQFTRNRGYFTNKGDIRVIEFSAFRFCGFGWRSRPENNVEFTLTESTAKKCVVIGNIHEQAEQKDVK